jgi:hypothetical protein
VYNALYILKKAISPTDDVIAFLRFPEIIFSETDKAKRSIKEALQCRLEYFPYSMLVLL